MQDTPADWNCDDMEKDWTSVPSSQTRHSTVESGGSINNFFDMRTSSSRIIASPKIRERNSSSDLFECLPRTELFFEIRHFLEAPENVLLYQSDLHDQAFSDGQDELRYPYETCRMYLTEEGSRISILPKSSVKRTELSGVYITDIAAILVHAAIPTPVPQHCVATHSKVTKATRGDELQLLYGLSVVATEQIIDLFAREKWRRDRMVERLNHLRGLTLELPSRESSLLATPSANKPSPNTCPKRWFRQQPINSLYGVTQAARAECSPVATLSMSYDGCGYDHDSINSVNAQQDEGSNMLPPRPSSQTQAHRRSHSDAVNCGHASGTGTSGVYSPSPIPSLHGSAAGELFFFEIIHHECPHHTPHKLLSVDCRERVICLMASPPDACNTLTQTQSSNSTTNQSTKIIRHDLSAEGDASCNSWSLRGCRDMVEDTDNSSKECLRVCARASRRFCVPVIKFGDVCEIRAGNYACHFAESVSSEEMDKRCLSVVGCRGCMCLQCSNREDRDKLLWRLLSCVFDMVVPGSHEWL